MIFLTVGAQSPFDRLVKTVDLWAAQRGRHDVIAQIGATKWRPETISWVSFLTPVAFHEHVERADVLVAHAGIGSIFAAMELNKPIVVMPRRAALRETRNDHQLATARQFAARGITVAYDEAELIGYLDRIEELSACSTMGPFASAQLLETLREFVSRRRVCEERRNPYLTLREPPS